MRQLQTALDWEQFMNTYKLTALAFFLAAALVQRGEAEPVWASRIGGTCVPDSATIRAGNYETAGFGVRFGGNSVGQIRLLCPFGIDGYGETIGSMEMSVIDEDGMEAGGRIRAHLRRAVKGTNVWIAIATCDSNTSDTRTPHKVVCPVGYKLKSEEWYWWDVEIERTTPRVNVEFLGLSLLYQTRPL